MVIHVNGILKMKKENKLVAEIGTNDLANDIEKQQEMGLTPEIREKCKQAWENRLKAEQLEKGRLSALNG